MSSSGGVGTACVSQNTDVMPSRLASRMPPSVRTG
jgi:hypothetical protein